MRHVDEKRDQHRKAEEKSRVSCALDPAASFLSRFLNLCLAFILATTAAAAAPENEYWDHQEGKYERKKG